MIYLIAAMSDNGVIGINNELPWSVPEDMQRFKTLTTGNVVVMGRKTFVSIGQALPERDNVVLTKTLQMAAIQRGCYVSPSIEHFLVQRDHFGDKDIFVIGGAEIYSQFMDKADGIYLTLIHQEVDGDTYFPEIPEDIFEIESAEAHEGFTFLKYRRK